MATDKASATARLASPTVKRPAVDQAPPNQSCSRHVPAADSNAPAAKAAASAAHEVPAAAKQGAQGAAVELPQWQLTAGHCRLGAHAGQPAWRPANKLPVNEQPDDRSVAAKNGNQPTMNRDARLQGCLLRQNSYGPP